MPKIFEINGYIISFYSNEHLPVHVHAIGNGSYLIRDYPGVTRECRGVKASDKAAIEFWIDEHWDLIIYQWNEFFKDKPDTIHRSEV
jgi:hypothetical protein